MIMLKFEIRSGIDFYVIILNIIFDDSFEILLRIISFKEKYLCTLYEKSGPANKSKFFEVTFTFFMVNYWSP